MSIYRTWEFRGCHKDGSPLTSREIEALVSFDEFDLECMTWEMGDSLFGWGDTQSIGAYERIEEAVREFKKVYLDVRLVVICRCEVDVCPDALFSRSGETEVHSLSSRLTYYDDETGEEVEI